MRLTLTRRVKPSDALRDAKREVNRVNHHPRSVMVGAKSGRFVVPYAPRESTHNGAGKVWQQVPRPGRLPLLVTSGSALASTDFDLILGTPNYDGEIDKQIALLRKFFATGETITWSYGALEHGAWKMTRLDVRIGSRQHGTNKVSRAVATITLTQASEVKVAAISGKKGSKPSAPKGTNPPKNSGHKYTVKRGDTLSGISLDFYDTPNRWREIADANGIKDPRKLRAGAVIIIPPE